MDEAGFVTSELVWATAYTAAAFHCVSSGSAPVLKINELVGAYGVSGATSQQDEENAMFAREKVGWAVRPEKDSTPSQVKKHINELYEQTGLAHLSSDARQPESL